MHEVTVEREIDVASGELWRIIDDFGGVYRFHPLVERSPVLNGKGSGLGAQRVCHFYDGNDLTEEIVRYEPGRGYEIEVTDPGSFPLKRAVGRISVEPIGESRSRVSFRMAFHPKFGPLGWLMGKTVMRREFRRILSRVLAGLEEHATTGEVVGPNRRTVAV